MTNDDITHPRTVAFWLSRAFLVLVLLIAFGAGARVLIKLSSDAVNDVVHDSAWEKMTRAGLATIDSDIVTVEDAIQRNEAARAREWISRETTRKVAEELNEKLLALRARRGSIVVSLVEHDARKSK